MAVLHKLSTQLTNETGTARGSINSKSHVRGLATTLETGAAADANSTFAFGKIPVDAVITNVLFASDDLGTTGTIDIGLFPATVDPTTMVYTDAISQACIASAIDVNTAAVGLTEVRCEAANIDTIGKKAWEIAGLSAKPAYGEFIVAGTAATATTAAGTMSLIVKWL